MCVGNCQQCRIKVVKSSGHLANSMARMFFSGQSGVLRAGRMGVLSVSFISLPHLRPDVMGYVNPRSGVALPSCNMHVLQSYDP